MLPEKPVLAVIVSGLSGVGKSGVIQGLMARYPFTLSVSDTARGPRTGEIPEVTYHYISPELFEQRVQQGYYVEYTDYSSCYGTPLQPLLGKELLLFEVDLKGQRSLPRSLPAALGRQVQFLHIYLYEELDIVEGRLRGRALTSGETEANIQHRMDKNRGDLPVALSPASAGMFDLLIRNRDTEVTVGAISQLVDGALRAIRPSPAGIK